MASVRSLIARRRRVHFAQRVALCVLPAAVLAAAIGSSTEDEATMALLGLLIGVPACLIALTAWAFREQPRLVLLLRPFNHAALSRSLVRLVRQELGFVGVVVTLADANVRSRHRLYASVRGILRLGGPLIAWLGPASLSADSRSSLESLRGSLASSRETSMLWLLSWNHLVRVPASDRFWQDAIRLLIDSADLVVVDVSEVGAGSAWELKQVYRHDRVLFVASQGYLGPARELVATLFPKRADTMFGYRADGTFVRGASFVAALEDWF